MGFVDTAFVLRAPPAEPGRCLFQTCRGSGPRPQDALWLLVLGLAGRAPVAPLDALRQAQALDGEFTPTTEVVAAVVEEVEASGAAERDRDGRLVLTAHGRGSLARLMTAPAPSLRTALGRVEARLRLGFVDLLPPAARPEVLDRLIAAARGDLAEAARRLDVPAAGTVGRSWAAGELAEAAGTVERLRALRSGLDASGFAA